MRQSWNQSRQVMRLPVQLWKYSCAMIALDMGIVRIGSGLGLGEHQLVVEDVEALVLHRTHVEMRNGNDIEHVEIIVAPIDALIPAHAAHQRIQRPAGPILLALLHPDGEFDLQSIGCDIVLLHCFEVTPNEREEVAGFGVRIVPQREVARRVRHIARCDEIAVAEQYRCVRSLGLQPHGVDAHHIRAVEEVCDPAKTIRLALGAIHAIGEVEPHQLGIARRIELREDRERETAGGRSVDRQCLRCCFIGRLIGLDAINQQAGQRQFVAVEHERRTGRARRVRHDGQQRPDPRVGPIEAYIEIDRLDQVIGRSIIFETDQ